MDSNIRTMKEFLLKFAYWAVLHAAFAVQLAVNLDTVAGTVASFQNCSGFHQHRGSRNAHTALCICWNSIAVAGRSLVLDPCPDCTDPLQPIHKHARFGALLGMLLINGENEQWSWRSNDFLISIILATKRLVFQVGSEMTYIFWPLYKLVSSKPFWSKKIHQISSSSAKKDIF